MDIGPDPLLGFDARLDVYIHLYLSGAELLI
jgi:hypothetical protein